MSRFVQIASGIWVAEYAANDCEVRELVARRVAALTGLDTMSDEDAKSALAEVETLCAATTARVFAVKAASRC